MNWPKSRPPDGNFRGTTENIHPLRVNPPRQHLLNFCPGSHVDRSSRLAGPTVPSGKRPRKTAAIAAQIISELASQRSEPCCPERYRSPNRCHATTRNNCRTDSSSRRRTTLRPRQGAPSRRVGQQASARRQAQPEAAVCTPRRLARADRRAQRLSRHRAAAGRRISPYSHSEATCEPRLAEFPDWMLEELEVVQFSRMTRKKQSFPCYGMQWGASLYLYPIEDSLIEYYQCPPTPGPGQRSPHVRRPMVSGKRHRRVGAATGPRSRCATTTSTTS